MRRWAEELQSYLLKSWIGQVGRSSEMNNQLLSVTHKIFHWMAGVHRLQRPLPLGARALFQSDQQWVLTPNTTAPEASSAHCCFQRTKTFLSHCNGRAAAIHTYRKFVEVLLFLMRPPDLEPFSLCWWQSACLWPNRATYYFNTNELSASFFELGARDQTINKTGVASVCNEFTI